MRCGSLEEGHGWGWDGDGDEDEYEDDDVWKETTHTRLNDDEEVVRNSVEW